MSKNTDFQLACGNDEIFFFLVSFPEKRDKNFFFLSFCLASLLPSELSDWNWLHEGTGVITLKCTCIVIFDLEIDFYCFLDDWCIYKESPTGGRKYKRKKIFGNNYYGIVILNVFHDLKSSVLVGNITCILVPVFIFSVWSCVWPPNLKCWTGVVETLFCFFELWYIHIKIPVIVV